MKKLLSALFFAFTFFGYAQLTQNFESGTFPPTGWTSFDNNIGTTSWGTTTSAALTYGATGTSAFLNKVTGNSALTAEEYLVTSQVTVPANGQLRFYTRTGLAGNDGSTFSVRVSTTTQTGTAAFTTIPTATWDENTLTATFNIYEEKVVSLAAFAGQNIYIAFVRTNENGDRWLIDNVNVVQSCNAPTTLTAPVATVGTTFASLGWTGPTGATQWQIEVVPLASNFTGVPNYTANSNPFVVTGLTQGTAYKFQVRAICPSGFPSDWSTTSGNFTTTIPGQVCAAPIVVSTLPYSTTSNTSLFGDTNDITQPLTCSGSATNYMAGNDVFYTYTPAASGNIAITLTPTVANSSIHVYSACPGTAGATCLAGVANGTSNVRVINPFAVTAGTTYYIIISSSASTQTVGYTLDIQQVFCTQPNALAATSITSTSATLSWGNPSGATSWEVAVAPAPYGLPTGAGTTVNTNTGYVYNGVSGIVYQYYVRANCNDGNFSIWSGPFTFTLPQSPSNLPFTDGFETLTGWTLNNATQVNKWVIGSAVNNGGSKSLYVSNDNGTTNTYGLTNTSIVHAYKDFTIPTGITQVELKFDWRAFGESGFDLIRVWAIPATITPTAGTGLAAGPNNIKIGNDLLLFSNWNTISINDVNVIPFAGSTMRLVFEWRNDGSAGVQPPGAIDNIELKIVTCPKPKNLTSANVSYNQAQVSWVNGGTETQWEVLVLPQGSTAPTATSTGTIVNSPSPYLITGLTSVTCYDVYVRAICSTTDKSYWSVPLTICTTPNFCSGDHFTDTGGTTGGYQNNQNYFVTACPGNIGDVVTVVFNSFNVAAGDNLIIRNGDLPTSPIVGTYSGATLPPSFTSTSPSGCLTFSFTSNATGTSTGWDATIYCTPPITCFKPTAVTVSNITATTASVSWTESGSATQWQVLVLPSGSNVPTFSFTGISATSPFLITGLSPSSTYTFYVRAICSATDKSFWTDGVNFSTTPLNDNCSAATVAIVNDDLNCTLLNNGVLTGSTPTVPALPTCSPAANDVWYQFVAVKPTHTFSLSNILPAGSSVNFALYSGTCSNLTQIQCNTTATYVANNLVIGQTYYVRIYSSVVNTTPVSFSLCIGAVPCPEAISLCNQPRTYPNATGVINLGPYACLGSSPNASFFFLEAAQNGSLSYTITQVTTGGTPIDVDYALWGPFPSRDAGCVLIPNGSPVSCSYSAAATENFTITVTQGQVYILMVTNFANQAGSVTITPNINNTAQSFCYPYNTFNYSAVTYCSNSANQTPVLIAGATAGTYSATPSGLSINSVTGEINFAASAPGTYTVTNTLIPTLQPPATNNPIICTRTVIVTPNPNATISYSSSSYCNSDSVSYPVSITGTSGPNKTFSSTPLGLQYALDPVSGTITPSLATPGTYTITMTIPAQGGCAAYTTNTTVEIKTAPQLPIKVDVNGCNSYTLPALTTGAYYTGSNATGTQLNAGDVITTTQVVYVYVTNGDCSNQVSFKVNIISIPTPTVSVTSQPTCSTQTGNMQVTSPIIQSATTPSDIFISEVTDANTGALSYVELYNGTGSAKNLANYKLKMYNNGNAAPTWQQTLSGTIANNSTFVIKISNDPSIPGVSHNLLIPNSGVDTNDNIRLTTVTDVEIDMWGPTNGTVFTPNNQPGYTYRRLASSTPLPTTTWNTSQWSTVDPENYSNIGQYSLFVSNYQYSVDNGTFQSSTTFNGLTPGTHTLVVRDLINDCYSSPTNFTINAVPYTNPVTTFSFTSPVCSTTSNPSPALATGFTLGGTFSATPAGLVINSTTGVINIANSALGTYTVTYNYPGDLTNCINPGTSTAEFVYTSLITPTFNPIAAICSGATLTALPTISTNNIVGSWSPALNNTATTTYTFTPNAGQCAVNTTLTITVNPNISPTFTQVNPICSGDVLSALPTTSTNSITGTWSPALNNTATTTYTFTPTAGQCATGTTMTITVNPFVQPVFTPIADLCVGTVPIVLSSTSNNGVTGVWSPSTVNTAAAGTTVYNFTPNGTGCYLPTSLTVNVYQCQIQRGISPNGDGLNDYLDLTADRVEIFNRYGGKVYSKVNYHNDWFGQSDSGSVLPDGTYYYSIKLLGGELKTGWIYINKEN